MVTNRIKLFPLKSGSGATVNELPRGMSNNAVMGLENVQPEIKPGMPGSDGTGESDPIPRDDKVLSVRGEERLERDALDGLSNIEPRFEEAAQL
jgi:hypothetical protein